MIERAAASAALDSAGAFSASCDAFESSGCRCGSRSCRRRKKKPGKGPGPGLRLGILGALSRLMPDP
jgi:hypothetical protein